ncbi:DUF983 domain-containing protein [Lutibacter citreus]|uniref:DUF983 domain-containing protein n=1 Tax=Lutibacter citreus TaxID=2138210 RepID=UPI001FECEAF3|nr:DUF983 domain-containing protein [Lutibacter citreus]
MEEKNIFNLKKASIMKERCPKCNLKYMMEPSFYYGAMYVTYALTVGISIITFIISTLVFNLSMIESFIPIVLVLILTSPISLRFSRIIWINIFVHYDPNSIKSKTD